MMKERGKKIFSFILFSWHEFGRDFGWKLSFFFLIETKKIFSFEKFQKSLHKF